MRSWLNSSSTLKRSQEPGAEQGPATAQEPGAKADRGPATAQEPGAKADRGPADSGPLHRWLQGSSKKPRLSVGTEGAS